VGFDDGFDDGESHASAIGMGVAIRASEEAVEDERLFIFGDACALVRYRNMQFPVGESSAKTDG
jgi:hypothetical protein